MSHITCHFRAAEYHDLVSCVVHPVFDHKVDIVMTPPPHPPPTPEIRDLMNINELFMNFDVEVTYFLHIHLLGNPTDFRISVYSMRLLSTSTSTANKLTELS